MLPRWHILLGLIFSLIIWIIFPYIDWIFIALIFLSSFLIDFDHYMCSVYKTGKLSLFDSFEYHRKERIKYLKERSRGIRRKGDFHIFHTIEFNILVFLLGYLWAGFYYILIGMLFHSILDIISGIYEDWLYRREFLLARWLIGRI